MDDFVIQYHGFSPSRFAQSYIQDLMEKLRDEAPASAALRISITKVDKHAFKGFIRISSQAGSFFAQASSSKLTGVAHRLLERMRRKLDKWKSRRFNRDREMLSYQSLPESQRQRVQSSLGNVWVP